MPTTESFQMEEGSAAQSPPLLGSQQRQGLSPRATMSIAAVVIVVVGVVILIIVIIVSGSRDGGCTELQKKTCTQCQGGKCTACIPNHAVENGECLFQCSEQQKKEHCTKCSDAETCAACIDKYEVNGNGTCVVACTPDQKAKGCVTCASESQCTGCADDYFLFPAENETTTCRYQCSDLQRHCTECESPTKCLTCESASYHLVDGNCVWPCSEDQLRDGCHSCESEKRCLTCNSSRTLFEGSCLVDKDLDGDASCSSVPSSSYYTFRARSNQNYPPNGIDTASAAGVMRYIHEEVVGLDCCVSSCVRKYDIDRIQRYKVTVRNYQDSPDRFTEYVAFDKAQCTSKPQGMECGDYFLKEGYRVGCQTQHVENFGYDGASWYSFPGTCPSQPFDKKTEMCNQREPGGACHSPDGTPNCTYKIEEAGVVFLDELVGLGPPGSYKKWCEDGGVEFVLNKTALPKEETITFWQDRMDTAKNKLRTLKLLWMFEKSR